MDGVMEVDEEDASIISISAGISEVRVAAVDEDGSEVRVAISAANVEACIMDDVPHGAASAVRESDDVGAGGDVFLVEEHLVDGCLGQE